MNVQACLLSAFLIYVGIGVAYVEKNIQSTLKF